MSKFRLALGTLFAASLFVAASCSKKVDTSSTAQYIGDWKGTTSCGEGLGGWDQKAPFFANGRKGAVSFSINNIVYVAGGNLQKDFWAYDPSTNGWTRLADVPGVLRYRTYATAFTMNNKGYITCGADSGFYKNDVWMYDPSTNLWTMATNAFPGKPRIKAFSFVVNDVAYVGGGVDTGGVELSDFYAYDYVNDAWTAKANFPRTVAMPFAFSTKTSALASYNPARGGYVSCGRQNSAEDTATFYYDSSSNSWQRVAGFPSNPRHGGTAFTLVGIPYCGLGSDGVNAFEDLYSYNPAKNKWTKLGNFPGRFNAEPISGINGINGNGTKAYVGLGSAVINNNYTYWYEFTPPSDAAAFSITAGPNNYSLYLTFTIGKDSCQQEIKLLGTVSSTTVGKEYFSIGTNSSVDKCGNNYSVTGSGSLNGDVMTITTVTSSGKGTSACTFTGKR